MIQYIFLPLLLVETTSAYVSLNSRKINHQSLSLSQSSRSNLLSADADVDSSLIMLNCDFASAINFDATIPSKTAPVASSSSRFGSSSSSKCNILYTRLYGGSIKSRSALFCLPTNSNAESATTEIAVTETISDRNVNTESNSSSEDESNGHSIMNNDLLVQHRLESELQIGSTSESHEVHLSSSSNAEAIIAVKDVTDTPIRAPSQMIVTKMESPIKIEKKKENGIKKFLKGNWLVIGEVLVIMMAKMNPSFGATGGKLRPEFFISKLGVFTIFFINGIALSIGKYFF